jgi:WS/DGAT/MGAT family acyltransferase
MGRVEVAIKQISPIDLAWLLGESADTPMHVSGFMEFTPPPNASPSYLHDEVAAMFLPREIPPPFNLKPVKAPIIGARLPALQEVDHVDLDYHIRHSALPKPGGQRELGVLVSRLHGNQLDFNRPLWELHVIEGLADGRFAIYVKIHHCLIDGVSIMRHLTRSLSTDPDERDMAPFFAVPRPSTRSAPPVEGGDLLRGVSATIGSAWGGAAALGGLSRTAASMVAPNIDGGRLTVPYAAPSSVLGGRVAGRRRFASQQYDLERIKALAKAAGATINEIVLYLSGTALRRYLAEVDSVPDRSLTAGLPVSLRADGDDRVGTAIGMMLVDLATNIEDPRERLTEVIRSSTASKEHLRRLSPGAVAAEVLIANGPFILTNLTPLGGRVPVPFNVAISNVPGPQEPHFYNGARLDGFYPISMVHHGVALNITCLSYNGTLNFGFVGARDTLPHLQHLALHMADALDEITGLLLPPTRTSKRRATA